MTYRNWYGFFAAAAAGGADAPAFAVAAAKRYNWGDCGRECPAEEAFAVAVAANAMAVALSPADERSHGLTLFGEMDGPDGLHYASCRGTHLTPVDAEPGVLVRVDGEEAAADHYRYLAAEEALAEASLASVRRRQRLAQEAVRTQTPTVELPPISGVQEVWS